MQMNTAPQIPPVPHHDVDATVLICTYNRADYLADTLDSLATSAAPGFTWDVMIVDNNSSDHTRAVVEQRVDRYPVRLRYLFERRQGKSNALNAGMAAARAKVIVFTDDDVRVSTNWLRAGVEPLLVRRDIDYTGGPVEPIWTAPRPHWLNEKGNLGGTIAVKDHGPRPFVFEDELKTPLGVNMAVHRRLVERIGGFRPDLGRNGKSLLGQEQAEFFFRSRAAGTRGLYVPEMSLAHIVPASRLTRSYFRRWWYWKGISHARVHHIHGASEFGIDMSRTPRIFGIPRFILGNAVNSLRSWLAGWFPPDPVRRTERWLSMVYCLGYCREAWRQARRGTEERPYAAKAGDSIENRQPSADLSVNS